jgi:type II secretory pathway component PulK
MSPARAQRSQRGIALALVLIMVVMLVTAVYTFARRAVINASISQNRVLAAEAEALARGGLRVAEGIVYYYRLQAALGDEEGGGEGLLPETTQLATTDAFWARLGDVPIEIDAERTLQLSIEDAGARLNLNALVPQDPESLGEDPTESSVSDDEEAEEYLVLVLQRIIENIDARPEDKSYDERALARNLLDYMDSDDTARDGRGEDTYYRDQDPPYRARNGPLLSIDEVALVEGFDRQLTDAMRHYVTVHPIGGTTGINLNTAPPWVLGLVYAGPSGDRDLIGEPEVRRILGLRKKGEVLCEESSADPERCVSLSDVGLGEGSLYPETPLPADATVFRVVAEARVAGVTRRMEAIYDLRELTNPQLLSWRRLRGPL